MERGGTVFKKARTLHYRLYSRTPGNSAPRSVHHAQACERRSLAGREKGRHLGNWKTVVACAFLRGTAEQQRVSRRRQEVASCSLWETSKGAALSCSSLRCVTTTAFYSPFSLSFSLYLSGVRVRDWSLGLVGNQSSKTLPGEKKVEDCYRRIDVSKQANARLVHTHRLFSISGTYLHTRACSGCWSASVSFGRHRLPNGANQPTYFARP